MKAFIHFSVVLSNHPGGLTQAWKSSSLTNLLFESSQTSIIASLSSSPSHTTATALLQHPFLTTTTTTSLLTTDTTSNTTLFKVLYSPFPVCFLPLESETHALFSSQLLYYFLFPFSDDRLWKFILCKMEHFHLGFFLLGSLNNICFTYRILNDMFDIVLLGQDNQQENDDEEEEQEQEQRLNGITRRLSKLLKGFLLTYCCSLVILFWIHFNIFAFQYDSKNDYNSKRFIAELPLWTLRWVTLGVAVGDFATRGIYRWLTKITNCVDQEDVLSLPENC